MKTLGLGLFIEFDELDLFGTEDETKVVYLKLKEDTASFKILKGIIDALVKIMISFEVVNLN